MSEYDTGNPVPSASIPDAWDNMQSIDRFANSSDETITTRTGKQLDTLHGINVKADSQRTEQQDSFELSQSERASSFEEKTNEFELRFSSQLSTQESTFSESQTDKENRFQQFLLSSGYVFLGYYENGPFQFSARNQYIRYNNQYYRLNAATDVGFTTTGADAASFTNDVTHFVLMDGDTLRQNLGSGDGLKLVGQCSDLTALRTIEPTASNQRISVASYSPGWAGLIGAPVGGGEFYYDPNDTTSADDDIFVFVTVGGKRWKRACSGKKICLEWKGVRPGDDAAPALNAIGAYLNSRAVAKGTVSGLPRVHVGAGVYPLSDTVSLTYAFRIKAVGNVEFTATGWDSTVAKDIFTIANPANMPAVPDKGYASGDPWLNGSDGTILITGPVYDAAVTNNVVGVGVGNLVTGRTPVRGNVMHGVSIRYCGSAIYLRMRRLYLTSFSRVHCELNNTHITCPNQSGTEDSGERIAFHECVFGGCRNQHVYVYMAPALHFDSCSFDFAQGSGIYLDGISEYGLFSFTNCHFENFNNYLINAQTGSRVTLLITNCDVFNNSQTTPVTAASASSPSRPMFNLANGGNVSINGFKLNYSYRPLGSLNMLVSSGTQTADTRTRVSVNGLTAGDKAMTPCPAAAHIMNRSNDFSGEAVGSTITSKIAYTTTHVQPVQDIASSWGAGMSASVVADGSTKVLQMVSADNTNFGYIQPKTAIPVSPGRSYSAYFSVQKLLATGGVNWSVSYLWYDKDGNLLSNDSALSGQFSSVYNDTTLPGYSTDAAENGNRKLSTTMCVRIAPPGAAYCRPYFSVSSFTGTINIVNFLMWEYQ
ncbi:right-handed parallel beta-helix repeat-containing protein [Klebsiella variicola]|nr:right-handed parallel beta-helix repeat-containing protein [Klebsiella variicola]